MYKLRNPVVEASEQKMRLQYPLTTVHVAMWLQTHVQIV